MNCRNIIEITLYLFVKKLLLLAFAQARNRERRKVERKEDK
jgi:hypothetical protein